MITQLRIQNFKSLRDVTLDLQRVNLLIGPNNCGKTNVLKALKFFSEYIYGVYPTHDQFLSIAFLDSKDTIAHLRPHPVIAFQLHPVFLSKNNWGIGVLEVEPSQSHLPVCKLVAGFNTEKVGENITELIDIFKIDSRVDEWEALYSNTGINKKFVEKLGESFSGEINYEKLSNRPYALKFFQMEPRNERFVVKTKVTTPIDSFLWVGAKVFVPFASVKIYHPDPVKLKDPYPIRTEEHVAADASNLVAFLHIMRNKYHDVYRRIEEDIQRFVPEFTAISFEIVDVDINDPIRVKYPDKSYEKIGLLDNQKRTFWAEDLSEGILYFLALLAIIHQPHPPQLLLLEEPEKGIHPRRIREVLDLIFELAEEKDIQVIMTTHSPLVVDRFSDIPESVFILEKPENETIVKNLQRDVIEPMNEKFREAGEEPIHYTDALGEHWAMGFLGGVPNEYP